MSQRRITLLDELRGLAVVLMVFYHTAYDVVYVFHLTGSGWFRSAPMALLQRYIAFSFILIAGAMCRFSHNNLRRGARTFLCGMLVTAVTALVMPSQLILFGILHFLGVAMMLYPLLAPLAERLPVWAGVLLSAALYLLTAGIGQRVLGFGPFTVPLPDALYDCGFLFPLGLHPRIFASADYYPLLPWIFLFLAGACLGGWFKNERVPETFCRSHLPALQWVGRHALPIYLLHQPLAYAAVWVVASLL